MADAADIATVIDNIEATYTDHGWSTEIIGDKLDDGAIPERVIALYWRSRASASIMLVNTSESGSSRGNDTVYPRLKALADEWDTKALAIENPVLPETATRGRLGSFPIRRV